jgi:predicted nucleotidyltransferase
MNNETLISIVKQQYPNIKLIYLFGSRANNQQTAESDWDIALLDEQKIDAMSRWRLSELLANKSGAEVDLIDLLQSTTVLNIQIVGQGKLLYDRENFADYFEMQTLSMYGRLQESRVDIIKNFVSSAIQKGNREGTKHG